LSIEEDVIQISVYPNPANDILFLNGSTNFTYQIFDISGKLIQASSIQNSSIDISTIAPGIYSIKIIDTNGNMSTQKFVKQ